MGAIKEEATAKELEGYKTKILCHDSISNLTKEKPRHGQSLRSNLDQQEHFLFGMMLIQNECIHPDCYHKFNKLEGCQEEVYDLCGGKIENTYACPACQQVCRKIVPFMGSGNPWHWGKLERKKDVKPATI